ncbi:MAG: excisionase family DNA-binding protein [Chloroflexota bacterium]|nr:excisionase family DNA-binding protein [Chloroflexota bacterium]
METSTLASKTVTPEERERYARIIALLAEPGAKLTNAEGESVEIPEHIRPMIRHLAQFAAANKAIFLSAVDKALTTQQAADILNVPHSHLTTLLDEGTIPYTMVGTYRRIHYDDLMVYYPVWKAEQKRLLDEMTKLGEEMGGYDLPPQKFEFDPNA